MSYGDVIKESDAWYLNGEIVMSYPPANWATNVQKSAHSSQRAGDQSGSFTPGVFKITPYSASKTTWNGGDGSVNLTIPSGAYERRSTHSGAIAPYYVPHTLFRERMRISDFQNERERTLQAAYAAVGESTLEGMVELGELKETLQMLKSPLRRLREFIYDDKRRRDLFGLLYKYRNRPHRFFQETGSVAADTWLEYRYGMRPLYGTLRDLMELCDKRSTRLYPISRNRRDLRDTKKYTSKQLISALGTNFNRVIEESGSVHVRSVVYYRVNALRSMAAAAGFAPEYLPEVMWELTRLSFVVDWFLSIGPWLGSYRVNPTISHLGNTVSTKVETLGEGKLVHVGQYPGEEMTGDAGQMNYQSQSYERLIDQEKPLTPLFAGLDNLDFPKIVDALSLIYRPTEKYFKGLK